MDYFYGFNLISKTIRKLKYIIYHSTASIYFREEKLEEMMLKFRKNNAKNSITGLLLYSEGAFLQLFEGEDKQVNKLMKQIQKDKTHHSLIVLVNTQSAVRMFPDWSMGFKTMPVQQFEKVKQFILPGLQVKDQTEHAENHPIMIFFESFITNRSEKMQNA